MRHGMLGEAVAIIGRLFDGGYVDYVGDHYRVDSAKLWDLHDERVPIGVAVSGAQSVDLLAPGADHLIAVEPKPDLLSRWDEVTGGRKQRKIGQLPICWDPDRDRAVERAHAQFRWFGGGWKVNAELPGPAGFARATQFVRPDDVAASIPCGPEVEPIVEAVRSFEEAGYTDVALVQIGEEGQDDFLRFAEKELLPSLR